MVNPWQQVIEHGVSELIEEARSAIIEEKDGTKRWRLEKAVTRPLWLGFEDGFAGGQIVVSQGPNSWSQRAESHVRPTLMVKVLNKSSGHGQPLSLRFNPPQETIEIKDVRAEPDFGTYGGAWHVAEIRDQHGGDGLWRDPDGSTWFKVVLPDEPPYVL